MFNKYCTLLSSKEWCINIPSGNDQTITVSYTSCFWAQLYDGHGCGGQDRSRTPLRVHSGGSWKLSSGTDALSNCWCPANPNLKLKKMFCCNSPSLRWPDVLAVDCILETDLFIIWYKKLHMWWNLAQILVRRDGFFWLSWLPVPRIERWSEKIAHVLLCKIWTWKCVLLLFPQEVWNDEYFPLDCISDTGSHGIWYEKLRLWWNRAWILVHMDGSGLSGYRVPRIEHWESNYTCPPVQIWTWKCVCAPLLEWLINCSLMVFCRQICSTFIWYKKWLSWNLASV